MNMKKSDRDEFRDLLVEQRREVLEHSNQLNTASRVGADGVPDFADYAAEKAEAEVNDRIADSESKLLEKIDLALQRIEDGTYDTCAECSGKIPLARLRAKPAVSLCVNCQARKEASGS
ncbi:MAG: TraR/DksA family transcriptional regulator [Verrucomicrobiales bacterium]|nr:TraR/DksA family transcriptional regulator [Verrucomicrobiales bacterium]